METTIHIGGRKHIKPAAVGQNYTKLIKQDGEQHFVTTTLNKLQARLQSAGDFFRPNRSYLLNIN